MYNLFRVWEFQNKDKRMCIYSKDVEVITKTWTIGPSVTDHLWQELGSVICWNHLKGFGLLLFVSLSLLLILLGQHLISVFTLMKPPNHYLSISWSSHLHLFCPPTSAHPHLILCHYHLPHPSTICISNIPFSKHSLSSPKHTPSVLQYHWFSDHRGSLTLSLFRCLHVT